MSTGGCGGIFGPLILQLGGIQMVILALLLKELLMAAHLGDALVGDVEDAVAVLDGGEPVGDDE